MVLSVIGGAVASAFPTAGATSFQGEIAALTAAFLWAAATLMFGRLGRSLSPLVLNIVKGVFAIALILITLLVRSWWIETTALPTNDLPITAMVYLLLSGGIGIGLGDTAYFAAINALGARRALLLETLAPPMTAVMAWIFLSEQLPFMAIAGILMTLLGVAWVISERVPATDSALAKQPHIKHSQTGWQTGLSVALLAVFCQASGAVLSRAALVNVAVDPLWSSLLRLLAGMAFMVLLAVLQPRRLGDYCPEPESKGVALGLSSNENAPAKKDWRVRWQKSLAMLRSPRLLTGVALAAFFGTYLGIWLQQIALKNTAAGIAQALLATSPLFVLPMAALLGDRISYRSIAGVAIALGGVWLLFYVA